MRTYKLYRYAPGIAHRSGLGLLSASCDDPITGTSSVLFVQSGKSSSVFVYVLACSVFHDYQRIFCLLFANFWMCFSKFQCFSSFKLHVRSSMKFRKTPQAACPRRLTSSNFINTTHFSL